MIFDIIIFKVQETLRYFSVSQYDYVPFTGETEDAEMPKSFTPLLSTIGKPHIPRSDFDVSVIFEILVFHC